MQGSYYNPNYSNLQQYVVKQNDSLYMIAKKHNITVEQLKNANHLVSNMIYPNQILFIPKTETKPGIYVTQNGDSIQKIIDKYHLELSDLDYYNEIGDLKVEPDQTIKMKTTREVLKTHTVTLTDTVEDILAKYHLSPLEFLKLNEKNIFIPGEKVIIEK